MEKLNWLANIMRRREMRIGVTGGSSSQTLVYHRIAEDDRPCAGRPDVRWSRSGILIWDVAEPSPHADHLRKNLRLCHRCAADLNDQDGVLSKMEMVSTGGPCWALHRKIGNGGHLFVANLEETKEIRQGFDVTIWIENADNQQVEIGSGLWSQILADRLDQIE